MSTKPTPKKRDRSPELLAASAAMELAKLDLAIARAKEALSEKEAAKAAIVGALEPAVKKMVDAMRSAAS